MAEALAGPSVRTAETKSNYRLLSPYSVPGAKAGPKLDDRLYNLGMWRLGLPALTRKLAIRGAEKSPPEPPTHISLVYCSFSFPGGSVVKNLPAVLVTRIRSLGWEDPLEEGPATHSSILVWRIPMDRGAWWATVHAVTKSWIGLSD